MSSRYFTEPEIVYIFFSDRFLVFHISPSPKESTPIVTPMCAYTYIHIYICTVRETRTLSTSLLLRFKVGSLRVVDDRPCHILVQLLNRLIGTMDLV